jgi:hypothetical protein
MENGKIINLALAFIDDIIMSYDFDIHKGYGQSTSNEKALEVLKRTPMTNKISEVHKRISMTN